MSNVNVPHLATATVPGMDGAAVTPSNTTGWGFVARALYIGGVGDVTLVTPNDTVLTFVGVPGGVILPIMCTRVNLTGTSATSIVAIQ